MVKARTDAEVGSSASDAGLRHAQRVAKLAHVIRGSDGSFEEWSETLPDLIGIDPHNVPRTARAWLDLLHPDDRPTFRAKAMEAEASGVRTEVTYRLRRPDGHWIHVRHVMEPLQGRNDGHEHARWFNTLQDVTEQGQTAQALAVSEARYWAIFEQVAVGVVHSDPDGRVLNVNPKFCELSGYSREDALTLSIRTLMHPEEIEASLAARAALLAGTSAPYEREARLVRKDRPFCGRTSLRRSFALRVVVRASSSRSSTTSRIARWRSKPSQTASSASANSPRTFGRSSG